MLSRIVTYSLKNKLIIMAMVMVIIVAGIYSLININLNAVPDITNNQVQIVTSSPTLASQEVEQFITSPLEMALSNLPEVEEVRSISRYGLSVITVVFDESLDILKARQYIKEQLDIVKGDIPSSMGSPELMPITTGLGEVYQYVLSVDEKYKGQYDLMELRTIHDWIVKRQLAGIEGVIEISSFGGLLKQYEIAVFPEKMRLHGVTFNDLTSVLKTNNEGVGGSYIEHDNKAFYLRSDGRLNSLNEIAHIAIKSTKDGPVYIKDVARVGYGAPKRFGAMTMDGKGEVVGGITLMLKDASSSKTVSHIHDRMTQVQKSLPDGVSIYPYLDRSELVGKTINTVQTNLIEGGLIVVLVLVLFLGNLRAGLIVASVIPLAMLFTFSMMQVFGVSANLMSLGAIDFGIVVDGAVIVVEGVLHAISLNYLNKQLKSNDLDILIGNSTQHIYKSAAFGVLIILVVFIPILTLKGIEGKMFKPMAMTISFAVFGALIMSLTYVPVMISLLLGGTYRDKPNLSDRLVNRFKLWYQPVIRTVLKAPGLIFTGSLAILFGVVILFSNMGGEFIPTLEEGDLAMQLSVPPGSSLSTSIRKTTAAEQVLKDNFPEVKHVVSKIGTAEVPTDPMAIEDADVMIILRDKSEWVSADNREDLIAKMKDKLSGIDSISYEFTQPIQLRFNELMTGAKSDIVVKITGENTDSLKEIAHRIKDHITHVRGAADIKVEQTDGLPQLNIKLNREKLNFYNVDVAEVNMLIKSAYAGTNAGLVYEEERKFDIVVRLNSGDIKSIDLGKLQVRNRDGQLVDLGSLVEIDYTEAPMQISREDAKRMIKIGINVRNRDVASLVEEIQQIVDAEITLPAGYTIEYGGQFENMQNAVSRLLIVVPVALALILILLYSAFNSMKKAAIIFFAVPLSAIGGVLALYVRDLPFSISAAIGFIALFGVAVLNGLVMINEFNRLSESSNLNLKEIIIKGASSRLRPVLMTALVASLGFLPMALSHSNGAEVQRPLATVVIGGLVSATLLTLVVLPALYYLVYRRNGKKLTTSVLAFILVSTTAGYAQSGHGIAYSYGELVSKSSKYGYNLNTADYEKQIGDIESAEKIRLSPTQLGMQYGQINDAQQDLYIEIDQSFSELWKHRHYKKLGSSKAELAKDQFIKDGKLNSLALSEYFFQYKSSIEALDIYKKLDSIITAFKVTLDRAYDLNQITMVDYAIYNNMLASITNEKIDLVIVSNRAKQNICLLTGLEFQDSILTHIDPLTDSVQHDSSDYWYTSTYTSKELVLSSREAVLKSSYTPDLSIGYFHQSFNSRFSYGGVKLGLSIPVFSGGKNTELKKLNAEYKLNENQKNLELNYWKSIVDANRESILNLKKLNPKSLTPKELESQLDNGLNMMKMGEINMLELDAFINSIIQTAVREINYTNKIQKLQYENKLIQSK